MSGASPEPYGALRIARAAAFGFIAGAAAGAAVGVAEALYTWTDASHFLFTAWSKLRFVAFVAGLYGTAGAALGAGGGLIGAGFLRCTRLGPWLASASRRHRDARARDPREALSWLALVLAGLPLLALSLGATYALAYQFLATRQHPGLVVAVAMASGLAAVGAAGLATLWVERPVELALRALARRPSLARILSSPRAPVWAATSLVLAATAAAAYASWETLSLLPIRTAASAILLVTAIVPVWKLGGGAIRHLLDRPPATRRVSLAALALLLPLVTISAGGAAGARKTANHYTGLGGALMKPYRAAFDHGDLRVDVDAELPTHDPAFAPLPASIPERPNIVLITIDTLRHDHVGAYGYERGTTPHMDRVAFEGALFENSWAHAPSTRYSMPAILTGRYPLHVDYDESVRGWPGLSERNTTIAEIVKDKGYRTGAFTNHWYFDRTRRMDQGFDVYDNRNAKLHKNVPGAGPAETTGSSSRQQTDLALEFVKRETGRESDEPFFLWVHYYDPHYVYQKHPEVADFGDERVDLYDSDIAFTDHHIGRLLRDLRERGLWDETAVVIAADHGEGFGEKGIELHGYHLYAPQTRVPLIIRIPGTWPRRIEMPVGHVDILPTIANLVGAEPTREMMGRSLIDVITGQHRADDDRWIFQQLSFENNNELRGAASKQCHVIYNISPHTSWELYRIDRDPAQTRDVIGKPGPCDEAPEVLARWVRQSSIPWDAAEALLDEPPHLDDPLDVDFGREARLLAVDLPDGDVRRGEGFDVTYTFEAAGPIDDAWKFFVHVTSDDGGYFQGDHEPSRPFSWWQEGEYIRYTRTIQVPRDAPPGEYEVWMGMFRQRERKPLRSDRVTISDDRARVGRVTVR